MKWVLIALGLLVVAVVAFILWRLWATVAGGNRAYSALVARIQPVVARLEAGAEPAAEDLERFAADRATRKVLHEALEHHGKLALFPLRYLTQEAMAEADLSAWLNHPNELGAIPDEIEQMDVVPARGGAFDGSTYYLFRYRMHPPHWAAKDGWLAGVAGPYSREGPILATAPGTFSRFEAYDSRSPEEHVQSTHELLSSAARLRQGRPEHRVRREESRRLVPERVDSVTLARSPETGAPRGTSHPTGAPRAGSTPLDGRRVGSYIHPYG